MAGANLTLKANDILFEQGQPADGMYLVRKGSLCVYLMQNGHEVTLANIAEGGMIGEMSFFDKQPRSASVKAASDCEVTKITSDDFAKLMKQIPKWFVAIMTSLSSRLRDTNARLQKLENSQASIKPPHFDSIRALYILNLIWHKEASKEGKVSWLDRQTATDQLLLMTGIDQMWVQKFIDSLIANNIVTSQNDQNKRAQLGLANRANFTMLAEFLRALVKALPECKSLSATDMQFLETCAIVAEASPYEQVSLSLEDIVHEGNLRKIDTSSWSKFPDFITRGTCTSVTLVKSGPAINLRVEKNQIRKNLNLHLLAQSLHKAGLA